MTHLKRHKAPKRWPIARKGTTFIVRPNFSPTRGVPLLVVLRDMLKIAQNRKEVKKAIHEKLILINQKETKDDKNALTLFDTLTLIPSKKSYRLSLGENGKYSLEEISEKEAGEKITKVMDKKILKGKKVQLNLRDGKNYLSDIKCNTEDSVVVNFDKKKIEKCLPMKEGAKVIIVEGKHAGKKGVIRKLKLERKMASVKVGEDNINVLIKQIMAVE